MQRMSYMAIAVEWGDNQQTKQTNKLTSSFIMPQTLEKLKGHIARACTSVRPNTF